MTVGEYVYGTRVARDHRLAESADGTAGCLCGSGVVSADVGDEHPDGPGTSIMCGRSTATLAGPRLIFSVRSDLTRQFRGDNP